MADAPTDAAHDAADRTLDLYAQGRLPLTLAAMRLTLATADEAALAHALERGRARHGAERLARLSERLGGAAQARVRQVAYALDHSYHDPVPERVLARLAAGFDQAAAVSADAGVALYSLGDPALLAEITAEVTAWLFAEHLARPGEALLEVGCGAGRFLQALGPQARLALGVEISRGMAAEAARRLQAMSHTTVVQSSGGDLRFISDSAIDLVLFADSFPYIVQAGGDLPRRMIAETARVLRPDGRAVVLNWSYRGDPDLDREEAEALASDCGLRLRVLAPPRFRTWDASATVLDRV
jgi:SAM-dependent methyltransferase